jgi:hypothetical protein
MSKKARVEATNAHSGSLWLKILRERIDHARGRGYNQIESIASNNLNRNKMQKTNEATIKSKQEGAFFAER